VTQVSRRQLAAGVLGISLLVAAAIGVFALTRPFAAPAAPCDVDSLLSGCGTRPAQFAGTDCATVGSELGAQLNTRLMEVVSGPQVVNGVDRSVLAASAQVYYADQVNKYLRDKHMVKTCSADELVDRIEPQISGAVRAAAPDLLATAGATYPDWVTALRRDLRVVDDDEDAPYSPSGTPA
jgi:hypothetical protein